MGKLASTGSFCNNADTRSATRLIQCWLLVLLLSTSSCNSFPPKKLCDNSAFDVDNLIAHWNTKVAHLTVGTWRLEKYNDSGFIRQTLDGPSLLLRATVDKSRCVTRIDIEARRADVEPYASIDAWLFLIDVTNPQLPTSGRHTIFKKLGLFDPSIPDNDTYTVNKVRYSFVENIESNTFSGSGGQVVEKPSGRHISEFGS